MGRAQKIALAPLPAVESYEALHDLGGWGYAPLTTWRTCGTDGASSKNPKIRAALAFI